MQMLYNSDSFAVVQFDVPGTTKDTVAPAPHEPLTRGGYEIVDEDAAALDAAKRQALIEAAQFYALCG